jgi:proteasome lid subunit RPN8/RPN11
MPSYRVRRQDLTGLVAHAVRVAKHAGREICGLLVDNGFFLELVLLENKVRRGGGFAFYVKQVRKIQAGAKALGHEIVGTFHSHPAYVATPGESDIAGALDNSLMLIIDVCGKACVLWRIRSGRATKLPLKLV